MATYSTSFDSYTTDAQPSDWAMRWLTTGVTWATRAKSGAEGGKVLERTQTTIARAHLSWDAVDADATRADSEILVRFRQSVNNVAVMQLYARASGSAGSETFYSVELASVSATSLVLGSRNGGVFNAIDSGVTQADILGLKANSWYYCRFRVNGTSLKARIWEDGKEEPSTWQLDAVDSAISAAGWSGVGANFSGTTVDYDWFSVGTNGDTAPLSTSTATVIKTHQLALEGLLATDAKARSHQLALETLLATEAKARLHQEVLEVAIGESVPGYVHQMVLEVAISSASDAPTQQPRMILVN